jgi:hypothetical protein
MFYQPKIILATTFPSNEPFAKMINFHGEKKKNLIFGATTRNVVSISITFHFAKQTTLNQTKNLMTNSYISM